MPSAPKGTRKAYLATQVVPMTARRNPNGTGCDPGALRLIFILNA
jgi:hypothetical protein